jgi:hypothetical protein
MRCHEPQGHTGYFTLRTDNGWAIIRITTDCLDRSLSENPDHLKIEYQKIQIKLKNRGSNLRRLLPEMLLANHS